MESQKLKRMEAFRAEVACAKSNGIDILPSVDGPYAYDPKTGQVVGRKGTEAYSNVCMNVENKPITFIH